MNYTISKAKKQWAERIKAMKINHTNMMVKVTETSVPEVGGESGTNSWVGKAPIVFE